MKRVIVCIVILIAFFITSCQTNRPAKQVREDLAEYLDEYSNEYLLVGTDRIESFKILEQTETDDKCIYEVEVTVNRLGYWFTEYYMITYDGMVEAPSNIEKINKDDN